MTNVSLTSEEREALLSLLAQHMQKLQSAQSGVTAHESAMLKLAKAHFGGGDLDPFSSVRVSERHFTDLSQTVVGVAAGKASVA